MRLSDRERVVWEMVVAGMNNRHIAQQLGLRPAALRGRLYRVFKKTGSVSRRQLAKTDPDGDPERREDWEERMPWPRTYFGLRITCSSPLAEVEHLGIEDGRSSEAAKEAHRVWLRAQARAILGPPRTETRSATGERGAA